MSTDIVRPVVEVIPANELPGLQGALAEVEREATALPRWKATALALQVTTADKYAEAGQLLAKVRAFKKIPEFKLGHFLAIARRVTDWLRTEQNKHAAIADEIDGILKAKMSEYKRLEAAAAAAEERRINEELRKLAEEAADRERKEREREIAKQLKNGEIKKREAETLRKESDAQAQAAKHVEAVRVQPNLPRVSGVRMTTNWRFEIVDQSKIKREYLMPDTVRIGQMVRSLKNKEEAEQRIGGIRVFTE